MRLRTAAFFALLAAAIAWGVFADARDARLEALVAEVESAEDRIPHAGIRQMTGAETVELRIWSRGGEKRVEFLGATGPRKKPGLGAFPVFLKPGHGAWKRRVKDVDLAVRNYDIVRTGEETVAGRLCDVYDVRARHPGRASYVAAVDRENRFPLRFEVRVRGERVFETRFKEIEYHPAFPERTFDEARRPEWLKVETGAAAPDAMTAQAGFQVWVPKAAPKGFELRGSELIRMKLEVPERARRFVPEAGSGSVAAHLSYTDGIAVVSVVQCSSESPLWKFARGFIPGYTGGKAGGGPAVAQKISDRGGSAYILELDGTVLLVAGQVAAGEIESMIRTLERR